MKDRHDVSIRPSQDYVWPCERRSDCHPAGPGSRSRPAEGAHVSPTASGRQIAAARFRDAAPASAGSPAMTVWRTHVLTIP